MKYIALQLIGFNKIDLAGLLCVFLFGAQTTFAQNPLAKSSPDVAVPKDSTVASSDPAATELEIDRQQLQRIYKAISAYYQDHQDLPDWLSNLVPHYLSDENDLISPVEKRTGKSVLFGRTDPRLHTSYIYESGLLWENDPRAAALVRSNPSLGPQPARQSGPHIEVHVLDAEAGAPV